MSKLWNAFYKINWTKHKIRKLAILQWWLNKLSESIRSWLEITHQQSPPHSLAFFFFSTNSRSKIICSHKCHFTCLTNRSVYFTSIEFTCLNAPNGSHFCSQQAILMDCGEPFRFPSHCCHSELKDILNFGISFTVRRRRQRVNGRKKKNVDAHTTHWRFFLISLHPHFNKRIFLSLSNAAIFY